MDTTPTPSRSRVYGKGYRADTHDRRAGQLCSYVLLGLAATYPTSASLEKYEVPIKDQGPTGSCTGHGSSQGISVTCAAAGLACIDASPDGIYKDTRAMERTIAQQTLGIAPGPLTDGGAMPADVMTALSTWGIRPQRGPTSDGRNSDVDPSTVNDEPDYADLELSAQKLVVGQYRIDERASSFLAQVCTAIASGYAVGIGFFCDTAFEAWGENWMPGEAPVSSVDLNDPQGGGHWVCITSYRVNPDGSITFRGPNSWGTSWGDAGHFEVKDAWMKRAVSDAYVWKVAVQDVA